MCGAVEIQPGQNNDLPGSCLIFEPNAFALSAPDWKEAAPKTLNWRISSVSSLSDRLYLAGCYSHQLGKDSKRFGFLRLARH